MATKTTTVLVDDLTGEPVDTTVRFALDSREYELD
ncbi:MAG: Lsr2 family protein, partial [Actinomycetota bacterium]|nr:Lsr2 family protein [Actinomycetota bacterium]